MGKFLYGAAVQGIQNFIFQTNSLKEIIGASILVDDICTGVFAEQLGYKDFGELENDPNAILNAAGNIKYVFDDEEKCRKTFREFPKKVMGLAPGITFSQAVVKIEEGKSFADVVDELEMKLRVERNRPSISLTTGLMGMQRMRETYLPERFHRQGEYYDEGTFQKLKAIDNDEINESGLRKKAMGDALDDTPFKDTDNINYFTGENNWIAIIHADGNGLGQVVRAIGENDPEGRNFHQFSSKLNEATIEAAQEAVKSTLPDFIKMEFGNEKMKRYFPFRPIVLGGDDLTVIIRGDLAVGFTKTYLESFEKLTKEKFNDLAEKYTVLRNGLTACAGIAFIKSSFPYYYGYNLAEDLCSAAKKDAKKPGRRGIYSCLMFHKVQDSFVESYKEIVERELTTPDGHSFNFGPYYLDDIDEAEDHRWTIEKLLSIVGKLEGEEGNAIKSDVRQWLSAMTEPGGTAKAVQIKDRLEKNNKGNKSLIDDLTCEYDRETNQEGKTKKVSPAYDVLSLHSVIYQEIKL